MKTVLIQVSVLVDGSTAHTVKQKAVNVSQEFCDMNKLQF